MSSGLNNISGARNRSGPSCKKYVIGISRLEVGNLPELGFHPGDGTLQSDPPCPSPLWKDLARCNSTFPLLSEQLLFPQSCVDDGLIFLAVAVDGQLHLCVMRHMRVLFDGKMDIIPSGDIHSSNCVRHGETLKYWDSVCNTIPRVEYYASRPP